MDSDTFAKLATAIIDLTGTSPQDGMIQNQQVFGAHSADFSNKPPCTSKPDILMRANDAFTSNVNSSGFFTPNIPVPSSHHEQVPMDDFDPLESFTFWDGETFYCNQDLESECCAASSMPPEEEMAELQGYLIHGQTLTKDDFSLIEDSDLIHNPTLAELNAGRETVFDCSAESSFLSEDSRYLLSPEFLSKSVPLNENSFVHPSSVFVPTSSAYANNINCFSGSFSEPKNSPQSLLSSSCPVPSRVAPCPQYINPYDERLLLCPQNSPSSPDSFIQRKDQFSMEGHRPLSMHDFSKSVLSNKHLNDPSVLSTSAPPEVTMMVQPSHIKTESPRPSFGLGKQTPERTLSGFSSLSLSNDDESGSYFDDSDHDLDDFSSDEDAYQFDEGDDMFSTSWPPTKEAKAQQRKHRYFWQYNLQARGIKTQNLLPLSEEHDPYKLNDVKDPVFSEECALPVKHSGKARKGDGNDLTPNARKLYSIGMELKKLNRLIYNLNPTSDMNMRTKPLSRKEKNKLASRVCRLKKKAQHEANKIKLYGLQQEHKRLLTILYDLKRLIKYKLEHFREASDTTSFQKLENYLASHEPVRVAGNATEFVNEVLEKVSRGEPDGGLGKL